MSRAERLRMCVHALRLATKRRHSRRFEFQPRLPNDADLRRTKTRAPINRTRSPGVAPDRHDCVLSSRALTVTSDLVDPYA